MIIYIYDVHRENLILYLHDNYVLLFVTQIRSIELKYGAKFPYTSTVNYPVVYVPPTSVFVPPPAPARKVDPSSGNKW